jgi:hypothetical protein
MVRAATLASGMTPRRKVCLMSRSSTVLLALCLAGGLAATTVWSRSAFVIGFFVVFWGSMAALLVWLSRRRWDSSEPPSPEIDCPDPYVDECGVRHFQGDVYDLPNHPTPGAHGRV